MKNMEHLRYRPRSAFRLDDASSPFADSSGYSRTATLTGTLTRGLPLCSWNDSSLVVDNTNTIAYSNSPVYVQGYDVNRPFTLAASVYPLQRTKGYTAQEYRENILTNPSFEGASVTGYTGTSVTLSTSTVWAAHGTRSLSLSASGVSNDSFASIGGDTGAIRAGMVAGKTYTITGTINVPTALTGTLASKARTITVFTKSPTINSNNYVSTSSATGSATGSTRLSVTFTVPADATEAFIRLYHGSSTAGEIVYWDALILEESSTSKPYFDGSSPGYEWAAAANASISRSRLDVSKINYIPNPNLSVDASQWTLTNAARDATGINGLPAIKLTRNNNTAIVVLSPASRIPVTPGEVLSMSSLQRLDSTVGDLTSHIMFVDATGSGLIGYSGQVLNTGNGTTTTVKLENQVVPNGAVYATARFHVDSGGNGSAWVTNVILEKSATVSSYYDGNSLGAAWSGTANSTWSYLKPSSGAQQILSSTGKYDGLSINGTVVSFTTNYTTQGNSVASYDIGHLRRFDVVGVHTKAKNSLYIDGELVAEVDIDGNKSLDAYDIVGTTLNSGTSPSSSGLLLNSVAMYDIALSSENIKTIYSASNRRSNSEGLKSFGAHEVVLGRSGTIYEWKTNSDWNQATMTNCGIERDVLYAQTYNGVTFAGVWTDGVDLSATSEGLTIESVDIYYTGKNVTVEASVNGTTWQTVVVGENLTVAPEDMSADSPLFIRATFASGVAEAYLDYIGVRIYTDDTYVPPVSGRSLEFTNPTTLVNTREPMDMYDDNGLHLKGAPLVIGADPSDIPVEVNTIEVWFKPLDNTTSNDVVLINDGTASARIVDWTTATVTAGTLYRNGKADTSMPIIINGWNVVHLVLNAPTTGEITINSSASANIMLGKVVLYENKLSANDIAKVVKNYTGVPTLSQTASGSIVIAESATAVVITAHDYANIAEG